MTYFLALALAVVLFEVVAGVRLLRSDRPLSPPTSHPDWGPAGLPSSPYASRA